MSKKVRVRDLEVQIAQLNWKQKRVEKQIRGILNESSSMRERDTLLQLSTDRKRPRAQRIAGIIEDEMSRPLMVNESIMRKMQGEDRRSQTSTVKVFFGNCFC